MPAIPGPGSQPEDNLTIWRYMDFYKFYSILKKKQLVFANINLFPDKLEGTYLKPVFTELVKPLLSQDKSEVAKGLNNLFYYLISEQVQNPYMYAACWHCASAESALMWNMYAAQGKGVAIKSTYTKLRKILPEASNRGTYHIGLIDYIDSKAESWISNMLLRFFMKHSAYQDEKEVRILFSSKDDLGDIHYLQMDPSIYIDEVVVSPFTDLNFFNIVSDICNETSKCSPHLDEGNHLSHLQPYTIFISSK